MLPILFKWRGVLHYAGPEDENCIIIVMREPRDTGAAPVREVSVHGFTFPRLQNVRYPRAAAQRTGLRQIKELEYTRCKFATVFLSYQTAGPGMCLQVLNIFSQAC